MVIHLPYPPTSNKMYRKVGNRMLISNAAKLFYSEVRACVLEQHGLVKPLEGFLHLEMDVYPGDNRKRDLDNLIKITGDALTKAGVMIDDAQIKKITAEMLPKQEVPYARIRITQHERNPV